MFVRSDRAKIKVLMITLSPDQRLVVAAAVVPGLQAHRRFLQVFHLSSSSSPSPRPERSPLSSPPGNKVFLAFVFVTDSGAN
jgi:hypothetical protein